MNDMTDKIRQSIAAARRRAAQDRADAAELDVLAAAAPSAREARRLRGEAAEARERATELDAMFMRRW